MNPQSRLRRLVRQLPDMSRSLAAAALALSASLLVGACQPATSVGPTGAGGGAAGTDGAGGAPGAGGTIGATRAELRYSGSIAVDSSARVEISSPILPDVLKIYGPFPATLDGEKAMAHDAALTFDFLLAACAPKYPKITLATGGVTVLSQEQLATNFEEIGRCSYEQYSAKPYWIPRLINDVDLCGTELGADWHLISEHDLTTLTEADFQLIQETLTPLASGVGGFFGSFYFGLQVFVRADDGSLKLGSLAPGAGAARVSAYPNASSTSHDEGGYALRCIRRAQAN
jgi:hypothetical protein